jgi:sterol desaturase/sphingolipid hydroxylase (fatty acid hydroxylase superfamily)
MGATASGTSQFPLWVEIAVGAYFVYRLLNSARAEERKRRQQGQPHTRRDNALLLFTALSVVGILLCAVFLKPLNALANSRVGIAATILFVGGGLTYISSRRRAPRS